MLGQLIGKRFFVFLLFPIISHFLLFFSNLFTDPFDASLFSERITLLHILRLDRACIITILTYNITLTNATYNSIFNKYLTQPFIELVIQSLMVTDVVDGVVDLLAIGFVLEASRS